MTKCIHQRDLQSKTSSSVLIATVQRISTAMRVTVFTHATSRVQSSPAYWPPEYIERVLQCDWQHVTNVIFSYVWHALARSESFSDAKLEQLRWSCFPLRCSAWAAEQIFSDQVLSLSNCADFVFCSDAQPEQLSAWCHMLRCSAWAAEATCVPCL